jgi:diketogulonate reductase-like aldo/keto reductase
MKIHLGTYKTIQIDRLTNLIGWGVKHGISNIDTAQLYHNEKHIRDILKTHDQKFNVTTKVYTSKQKSVEKFAVDVKELVNRYSSMNYDITLLLHNPMPSFGWKGIEEFSSQVKQIGVSNHSISELQKIFRYGKLKPIVNQIEFHPYIDNTELLNFCKENGIQVIAHSIFLQGKCIGDHEIIKIAYKHNLTPAQIIFMWVMSFDIEACVNTTNEQHLIELLQVVDKKLPQEDIDTINNIHKRLSIVKYDREIYYIPELEHCSETDIETYLNKVTTCIETDMNNISINKDVSTICRYVPSIHNKKYIRLIDLICKRLQVVPKVLGKMMNKLREYEKTMHSNMNNVKHINKGIIVDKNILQRNLHTRELKYPSDDMINPKAMPVDVSNYNTLEPIIEYLRADYTPTEDMTFLKGTLFKDGRLDMCKQVVGPRSIGQLCDSVKNNGFVNHFLLGNNIALDGNYIEGATKMKEMIAANDNLKTLYLAGNCINAECMKVMCEGLIDNTTCEALWLKRNPIGPDGAKYIGEMLNHNHTLRLLDFHNAGLLDEGLINFCNSITCDPKEFSIEYFYLDLDGLTEKSITVFSKFLKKYNSFKSIFLSLNNFGNEGLKTLCEGLSYCAQLEHINIESCNITDLTPLVELCKESLSELKVISFGINNNTIDVQGFINNIGDEQFNNVISIIDNSPKLQLIHIRNPKFSDIKSLELLNHCNNRNIILNSNQNKEINKGLQNYHLDLDLKRHIREIKHSDMVQHIDSVYRGVF